MHANAPAVARKTILLSAFCLAIACANAARADVTYSSATRFTRAGNPSGPTTFTATDLAPFSHTTSGTTGFLTCTASMNSTLQPLAIAYSGRVSASGDHSSGVDFYGTAQASQTIVVNLAAPTNVWIEGSWTFVQGYMTNINSTAQIRQSPPGAAPAQNIPTVESPLQLAAGAYEIDTIMSSYAGPSVGITATADYSYTIRFQTICAQDFDGSGTLTVADIFAFLSAWLAGDPRADFDGGGLNVSDIFAYLNAWFAGC